MGPEQLCGTLGARRPPVPDSAFARVSHRQFPLCRTQCMRAWDACQCMTTSNVPAVRPLLSWHAQRINHCASTKFLRSVSLVRGRTAHVPRAHPAPPDGRLLAPNKQAGTYIKVPILICTIRQCIGTFMRQCKAGLAPRWFAEVWEILHECLQEQVHQHVMQCSGV